MSSQMSSSHYADLDQPRNDQISSTCSSGQARHGSHFHPRVAASQEHADDAGYMASSHSSARIAVSDPYLRETRRAQDGDSVQHSSRVMVHETFPALAQGASGVAAYPNGGYPPNASHGDYYPAPQVDYHAGAAQGVSGYGDGANDAQEEEPTYNDAQTQPVDLFRDILAHYFTHADTTIVAFNMVPVGPNRSRFTVTIEASEA
ncbi:hypothetical protein BC834DRAFT_541440 [Gloeopeniophorella convolvens]|nr:hypothetical protein BC834DRAFT_541440 [Gloeopeniophorella convolvens]